MGDLPAPRITVVIPTRDRPDDLRRCLRAIAAQVGAPPFEVVVVDDGSQPPVTDVVRAFGPSFRTLRTGGGGPAQARNHGAAAGRGDVLVFTDDDTEAVGGWLAAVEDHLAAHPHDIGVEGPVRTPTWDPLSSYSVHSDGGGAYLTCNVAYRAGVFLEARGFHEGFRRASGEDHDLAFRLLRTGSIGVADGMEVLHHPRELSMWGVARRGLNAESDVLLIARHPDRFPPSGRIPAWTRPLHYDLRRWTRYARSSDHGVRGDVRRGFRYAATAALYLACTATGTARGLRARRRGVSQ